MTALIEEKARLVLGVAFPLIIVFNFFFRPWALHPERAIFFGFTLVLAVLFYRLRSTEAVRAKIYLAIDLILLLIVIAATTHIVVQWEYITFHFGTARPIDLALGIMATLATLELLRRAMPPMLPVCVGFLLYATLGRFLPGSMAAAPISVTRLIEHLYIHATGLYGLGVSVTIKYIMPFLLMGCLLKATGAMDVLSDAISMLVGRTQGGPAKIAVIASSAFGTLAGSAVANVAFTGSFTIPLMKRYGYKPEFAAGVEACSSIGGQIMPPVLGISAFVMADLTGIPYLTIVAYSIVPALLYYWGLFLRVDIRARHLGLMKPSTDMVGELQSVREIAVRLIPLIVVFGVLIMGLVFWTPTKAALVASGVVIPVSFLRRESRLTPVKILAALRDTTDSYKPIAVPTIAIGIIIACVATSGLGLKFSQLLVSVAGDSLFPILILTAIACILMGMGFAGFVVYIFAAIMLCPPMVQLGIPLVIAHFFVLYISNLQGITPPVCLVSYTAAAMAGANLMKSALYACSIGIIGFFLPFFFITDPELLLQGQSLLSTITTCFTMILAIMGLTFVLEGYSNRPIKQWERVLVFVLACMLLQWWIDPIRIVAAVIMLLWLFVPVILKRRSQRVKEDKLLPVK